LIDHGHSLVFQRLDGKFSIVNHKSIYKDKRPYKPICSITRMM
jgi:hypothetical protein